RLPVDFLKIDGSFIKSSERDPIDQTMVRLIGEVAKAAKMQTIAEYVQSRAALKLLAKYGIDYAQGFHFGRPVETPDDIWLEPGTQRARRVVGTDRAFAIDRTD